MYEPLSLKYEYSLDMIEEFCPPNCGGPPRDSDGKIVRIRTSTDAPNVLGTALVVSVKDMTNKPIEGNIGSNAIAIVNLKTADGKDLKAVFKPKDGEQWIAKDIFIGGQTIKGGGPIRATVTNKNFSLAERELAAKRLDDELQLGLVPNTIVRKVGGKEGSLQEYVSGAKPGGEAYSYTRNKELYRSESAKMAAFDYLIGNTDRHGFNYLVRPDGKFVAIDHGLSFPNSRDKYAIEKIKDGLSQFRCSVATDFREDSLSKSFKTSLANKIDSIDVSRIFKGMKIDSDELATFNERRKRLSAALRNDSFRDLLSKADYNGYGS